MAGRTKTRSRAALGYCRVSSEGQANSGAGVESQRRAITAEAERRGWELGGIFTDEALSGKRLDRRAALKEALDKLEAGEASVLIVHKLDRLARSVADFATLVRTAERQGWAILVCDLQIDMTTPTGGLMANVTAAVAEWEGRVISQRTKEALAVKRSQGVKLGRPRTVDPRVAERIRSERANGRTLQAIADDLNADGITTPTGRAWSHVLVRKVTLQAP
ncbi:MAG: recombinase family protein [Acidimicrobiales bacterium]